ncbi:hypothetical protein OIU35_13165 [Boseaceae bacterium BT-24-1]|nr:hypothetical protein [Boseaceae bacterium BT-24-1]
MTSGQVIISVQSPNTHVRSNGPRPPAVVELPDPLQTVTVGEPFILDAIRSLSDLGDLSTSLSIQGPILSATNGLAPLDGIAGQPLVSGRSLPGYDPREPSQIERYLSVNPFSNLTDRTLPETQGFILTMALQSRPGAPDPGPGEMTAQSVLRDRTLTLEFGGRLADPNARIIEYRVLQANGRPLPSWLERAGRDMIVGEVPIDLDEVRLKIIAVLADGQSTERNIAVDQSTGEIRLSPDDLSWSRPPLFQERFAVSHEFSDAEIKILAETLRP